MSILFRLLLICGALLAFVYVLTKIRKSEITIADSTFWFLFSSGIVVLAIFPQVAYFFCDILRIESPVNFVYLVVITILVIKLFNGTVEIARLRSKLNSLVQEQALFESDQREFDDDLAEVLHCDDSGNADALSETR